MTDEERRVARGFDRLSPLWDRMVALFPGRAIPRSRVAHLDFCRSGERALILGGGTGDFLVSLLEAGFPGAVVALDPSRGMLRRTAARLAHRRPGDATRVELRHGTIDALAPDERFDLVCTHYVLDLFDEPGLQRVTERLDRALAPGGTWLVADFAAPAGGPLRRRLHGGLVGALYGFFGLTCGIRPRRLPPIDAALERLGWAAAARSSFGGGVLASAAWRRATEPGGVL